MSPVTKNTTMATFFNLFETNISNGKRKNESPNTTCVTDVPSVCSDLELDFERG